MIRKEVAPKHTCIRAIALMTFTLSNRMTLFIAKSVSGVATDLKINYANFAPSNVLNVASLHVFIMLR